MFWTTYAWPLGESTANELAGIDKMDMPDIYFLSQQFLGLPLDFGEFKKLSVAPPLRFDIDCIEGYTHQFLFPQDLLAMTRRLRADISLAFCSLLWGATFVVVKGALEHASVFIFLAVRFSVAAALMLAISWRAFQRFQREDLFWGLRLGTFMFLGYAFQTAGLQYTTPSKSGFVTGLSVVLVPLLLAIFWDRRLTRGAYAGALVAVFGLYFLTIPARALLI